jgi:beta-galactosidase
MGVNTVSARVEFDHVFAPAEGYVKAPEKKFRDDICLNGSWQFQPVALPNNFHEGRDPAPALPAATADGWEKTPLRVPSPWNVNTFADEKGLGGDFRTYPSYPDSWAKVKMGWMRRNVDVPSAWKGRRILLHFDAVAGDIQVLVNGKSAGERFDIFFPFDLDVTDLVKTGGSNEILVGVRKASLFDENGKYGRRTYQGGSFWGQHAVGIWQDVSLVAVPVVHVADVFVQSFVDKDTLKAEVTLRNDGASDINVAVGASAYGWVSLAGKDVISAPEPKWELAPSASLSLPASSVTVPAHGEAKVMLEQKVGSSLKYWTPQNPNLYGLLVDVRAGDQPVDRKYTRFGWRQVTLSGSQMLLNGKPISLTGESWHFLGIPQMSRRYAWAWFSAMRDANVTAVRLHAQPYPEFYLDVADEMGIFVLDETAIWASDGGPKLDSDVFWKDTVNHVAELVTRDRNHPSVFGWSVCNEVKPVVQNVFHGPQEMMDTLVHYYGIWADTCHRLDPTRQWISADGDDDGQGTLPTYVIHYGDAGTMERAAKTGKPWGVGEASGAYYMTPEQSAKTNGERSYESFEGRMEGIAIDSYNHLLNQKKYAGSYRSVFNLVWYGLQPLPLGLADTTRPPEITDGVFFPPFVEGQPGVQPERLGPYCTTLNPGYDKSLPEYKTWPLFDAIKDANADPAIPLPWSAPADLNAKPQPVAKATPVKSLAILAGAGGKLESELSESGVPFDTMKPANLPELLFVDGRTPPEASARATLGRLVQAGGTVVVWGVAKDTLDQLNALLPAPLELTDRKSSSLLPKTDDPVIAGLKPSDLYFSELSPAIILDGGLGGPLVAKSTVLLEACNTDWQLWNKRAEYAKTAMVVRSEREAKSSGAALIELKIGKGRFLVCNLPADPKLYKGQQMVRQLLENLGVPLKPPVDVGEPFLKNGKLVRVLAVGRFSAADGGADKAFVDPSKGSSFRKNVSVGDKRWNAITAEDETFDLRRDPVNGPGDNAVVYLSMWVFSSKSLDNLLLEPNMPKVDLKLHTGNAVELFLNGKSILKTPAGGDTAQASALPLQQGWNNLLVRLVHGKGADKLKAELVSTQPEFLRELKSSLQKP